MMLEGMSLQVTGGQSEKMRSLLQRPSLLIWKMDLRACGSSRNSTGSEESYLLGPIKGMWCTIQEMSSRTTRRSTLPLQSSLVSWSGIMRIMDVRQHIRKFSGLAKCPSFKRQKCGGSKVTGAFICWEFEAELKRYEAFKKKNAPEREAARSTTKAAPTIRTRWLKRPLVER